jgi:hypothetical protein
MAQKQADFHGGLNLANKPVDVTRNIRAGNN